MPMTWLVAVTMSLCHTEWLGSDVDGSRRRSKRHVLAFLGVLTRRRWPTHTRPLHRPPLVFGLTFGLETKLLRSAEYCQHSIYTAYRPRPKSTVRNREHKTKGIVTTENQTKSHKVKESARCIKSTWTNTDLNNKRLILAREGAACINYMHQLYTPTLITENNQRRGIRMRPTRNREVLAVLWTHKKRPVRNCTPIATCPSNTTDDYHTKYKAESIVHIYQLHIPCEYQYTKCNKELAHMDNKGTKYGNTRYNTPPPGSRNDLLQDQ